MKLKHSPQLEDMTPKYPTTLWHAHEEKVQAELEAAAAKDTAAGTSANEVEESLKRNSPVSSSRTSGILKVNLLCFSLGKIPVPLLTITENVATYLDYYEELRLMNHIPDVVKK